MRGPARKRRAVAGGKPLEVKKTRRAAAFRSMVHPISGGWRIFTESKALKATLEAREFFGFTRFSDSSQANAMKVTASERRQRLCEGETP
jgi:hypothetical protein